MIHRTAIILPFIILAGCGQKQETATKAESGSASSAAAAPITFQPGKWQATSELVSMEVPGMPPQIAKANVGQKTSFESCMTAEQAAKPPSDFFTHNDATTRCTTENFAMAGGKLDATMVCEDRKTPGKMTMTLKGDYRPTSYTATMTMVRDGAPAGGNMKITAKTSGKRVGECEAKGTAKS